MGSKERRPRLSGFSVNRRMRNPGRGGGRWYPIRKVVNKTKAYLSYAPKRGGHSKNLSGGKVRECHDLGGNPTSKAREKERIGEPKKKNQEIKEVKKGTDQME